MEEKETENKGKNKISITNVSAIITIIGVIFGIIIYFFPSKDITELKVLTVEKTQLTQIPEIEGLTANYFYQDSVVENLWKIRAFVFNTGSKTIIGKGPNTNLLSDSLSISFSDSVKILSIAINEKTFPVSIVKSKDNIANLDFKQWKKSEAMDVIAIVENFGKAEPFISIDERDILDAKVIFSDYKPIEANANKKVIDTLRPYWKIYFMILYFFIAITSILFISIYTYKSIKKDIETHKRLFSKKNLFDILGIISIICGLLIPVLWFF